MAQKVAEVGKRYNESEAGNHFWFPVFANPKGLCRDVSGVGQLGNGDVELFFEHNSSIDDVVAVIEQSFRRQDVE